MTTSLTKGFPQRCPVRGLGASRRPVGAARLTGHRCATEMRTLRNDTLNHKNNVSTLSGDLTPPLTHSSTRPLPVPPLRAND